MESKRFERVFLLFAREDQDIYGGQSPSGFVKIETVENRVKISSTIQGLSLYTSEELCLYIFGRSINGISFFNAGKLESRQSKCELNKEVLLDNKKEYEALKNIEGAVVSGIRNISNVRKLYSPLIAYKNNIKIEYREALSEVLFKPKIKAEAPAPIITRKEENFLENIKAEKTPVAETQPQKPIHTEEITGRVPEVEQEETILETNMEISLKESNKIVPPEDDKGSQSKETGDYEQYQNMLRQLGFFKESDECGEICMEPTTELQKELCENCNRAGNEANIINKQPLNSSKLRLIFNKYFEPSDPFKIRRQDYRWWKVGSPVQLNNILYQNNIKTPLLFNPQLMMAHFKYRHILIGIYSNRRQRREYLVCGVPAIYNVDEKPFGEYCRWAQLESSKPRHGAFGYWLVYIDMKNGNFLGV
jgi:hypothetical protein